MQCSGYFVVDQLKKTPDQISLMSLLMSSDSHKNALVKVLNEAYVPAEITSEHLESMVAQILEAHKISFHEDELPPEGLSHNKALHLTVKCRDKFVSRVLIDNGSAFNICPFTTLKALGIDIGKVRECHVNVRAFNGAQRSAIGEIDLALQIGHVEFIIEFQVLDISATYNLLLGRPWIHMAGAVPSTMHQNVKFVWSHQEVVIHGEASNPIYPKNSILVIESVERLDGPTFHIEEIVTATRGKEIKLPSVFMMVASEMLKNGFEPGRGIGARLHGIVEPIQLPGQNNIFGLGKQINKNADIVNVTCNETSEQNNKKDLEEYEEDVLPAELTKELEQFENKSKPNLDETEHINLGDSESIKETRISVHLTPSEKEKYLPTDPSCPPVKQKTRKFKTDLSLKIKEEVSKQFKANVIRVTKYPTWLANIVPVPKKDGKIRICVDYRDLNKASPKDDFPLLNIHILIHNCAKHKLQPFVDCFAGYHQILMDKDDAKKTTFITPWGCIVIG
ncbi:uncharacterized protein [Nicotiana sylvestris]|uniref:uncharacterized protein n=1 Tax=Nicotiana sylvestris TaxID=4096 RepID=UPI00388C970F